MNIKSRLEDSLGVPVTNPTDYSHGDFTVPLFKMSKESGKIPQEIGEELSKKIDKDIVSEVSIDGGYLNIVLNSKARVQNARDGILIKKTLSGEKILFEHTSPNPFKPLHIGHIMTNAIGESMARIIERLGAKVTRVSYHGDIGPHVAKTIWGIMQKNITFDKLDIAKIGEAYSFGSSEYENNSQEIDQLNKDLYTGILSTDEKIRNLYSVGKKISMDHLEEVYKLLNTSFDNNFFETDTGNIGLDLVKKHDHIFEHSDGAVVYRGENKGAHTRVFITSKDTPTYEAKELGLDILKNEKYTFNKSFVVVANEQKPFNDVVNLALKDIFPKLAKKKNFIYHGILRFKDGKMSSRKGDVVTGVQFIEDLSESIKKIAKDKMDDSLAKDLAVATIKYAILRQESGKDVIFDKDKDINFTGDTGIYLQYTLARMSSLIKKNKKIFNFNKDIYNNDLILRLLSKYSQVVEKCYDTSSPHHLVQYLTELSSVFNNWYGAEKIIGSKDENKKIQLVKLCKKVLSEGVETLGIRVVDKI